MKKRIKILLIGAAFIGLMLAAGSIYLLINKEEDSPAVVTLQELQPQTDFYLIGTIEPKKTVELKLDASKGKIIEKRVKVNDVVEAGQELFTYSNPEGDLAIKEAEQEVINQEKKVEQSRLETDIKWEQYNKLLIKQEEYTKKINEAKEEEQKQSLTEAKEEIENQINQQLIEAKNTENTIVNAKLELEKIQLELQNVKNKYGSLSVKAEIGGIIKQIDETQMNRATNEKAPENAFMTIVDTSQFFLKGTVDEFRWKTLKAGQKVKIIDRENGSQSWTGALTEVGQMNEPGVVDETQGGNPNLSQYPYTVALDSSDVKPMIGSHCFVEIMKETAEAQRIPKEYVVKESKDFFIFSIKNKKVIKQLVQVMEDKENPDFYQLEKQLAPETELLQPSRSIEEGMRIDD